MKVIVNGREKEIDVAQDLAEFLRRMGIDPQGTGFAVALNGSVIPRVRLAETPVCEGDRIEVVHAVQGG